MVDAGKSFTKSSFDSGADGAISKYFPESGQASLMIGNVLVVLVPYLYGLPIGGLFYGRRRPHSDIPTGPSTSFVGPARGSSV